MREVICRKIVDFLALLLRPEPVWLLYLNLLICSPAQVVARRTQSVR